MRVKTSTLKSMSATIIPTANSDAELEMTYAGTADSTFGILTIRQGQNQIMKAEFTNAKEEIAAFVKINETWEAIKRVLKGTQGVEINN